MQFTKLKIQGFKTFVEPAEVPIHNGLTGVVGPNGCGKSNLVEAMRWVMGENSYKNMRASGMDDVIFSGSQKRASRNTAEVTLTIDNSARLAPVWLNEADTLEISRKIEREHGSTYRINGKEVRARDVHLLFADASTGARSPALVRQGQISEIISAKPQARRKVLEEAAGISGLHARRHEAETRLKAAESNLERLTDILTQISTQVEQLRSQAAGAITYRTLSQAIKINEATLAWGKYSALIATLQEAEKNLAQEQQAIEDSAQQQASSVTQQAVAAAKIPALREEAAKAGAALNRLMTAREMLNGEEQRLSQRATQMRTLLAQTANDIAREHAMLSDAQAVSTRLTQESKTLNQEAGASLAKEQEILARLKEKEAQVAALEAAFNQATTLLAEETAKRNALERGLREAKERLDRLTAQSEELDYEEAKLTLSSQDESELERRKNHLEMALNAQKQAENLSLSTENAHKTARTEADNLRRPLNDSERSLQQLETEVSTLQKLLLPAKSQKFKPVLEEIKVQKGYEKALAAALGEDLDAAQDPAAPVFWQVFTGEDAPLPKGLAPLSTYVAAPQALTRRLLQIGLVTREEGAIHAKQLKTGQRLVSLEGDVWRWDGLTHTANAQTPAALRLKEKNRLFELEITLQERKIAVKQQKETADLAFSKARDYATKEQTARDNWRNSSRQVEISRESFASFERQLSAALQKRATLVATRAQLNITLAQAEQDYKTAQQAREAAPQLSHLETELTQSRANVMAARGQFAEIRAISTSFERDAQTRAARLKAIAQDKKAWEDRRANADSRIKDIEVRAKESEKELHALMDAPEEIARQRQSLLSAISEAEISQREASDSLLEAEKALALADKAANESMKTFSQTRESFARAEAKLESQKQRRLELQTAIETQFECAPTALVALAQLDLSKPLPDMKRIEQDLEAGKKAREKLGNVNLRADIELEENETRLTKLHDEQTDLLEAIKKLRAAIISLNKEGRERLLASFETVNANFKRLFVQLFGGGTADLQLVENDDPLEAGLDILAMPLGKKPQTISLLSGGEQALTAIALIFAVFLTNPAPICVLDEVDAPLDDANVERYCDLLDEMVKTSNTRFIVITHNPITMARMNRLFGVTMAERGVSQLVSVDLEKAELLLEQAA